MEDLLECSRALFLFYHSLDTGTNTKPETLAHQAMSQGLSESGLLKFARAY